MPEPTGDRLAVVVATAHYDDAALTPLRAPRDDAADLRDILADPQVGGFVVTPLIDRTAHQIRSSLDAFLAERRPSDLVVLYLSCHGLLDAYGRLFFAGTDTRKDRLASSGVGSEWLLDRLEDCRARRQVLILDCCFSGAVTRRAKGAPGLEVGQRFHGDGRGRVILTGSRGTEYSFEDAVPSDATTMYRSVFTRALLAGIRSGEADADRDGEISVDDAYRYAFGWIRAAGGTQTPQISIYNGEGDILLARNPLASEPEATVASPNSAKAPEASATEGIAETPAMGAGAFAQADPSTVTFGAAVELNKTAWESGDRDLVDSSIQALREAVEETSRDSPFRAERFERLAAAYQRRWLTWRADDDGHQAMLCMEEAVDATPSESPALAVRLEKLGDSMTDWDSERWSSPGTFLFDALPGRIHPLETMPDYVLGTFTRAEIYGLAYKATPPSSPNRSTLLFQWGQAMAMSRDASKRPEGLEKMRQAIQSDSTNRRVADWYFDVGVALLLRHREDPDAEPTDLDEEIYAFTRARELADPGNPNSRNISQFLLSSLRRRATPADLEQAAAIEQAEAPEQWRPSY